MSHVHDMTVCGFGGTLRARYNVSRHSPVNGSIPRLTTGAGSSVHPHTQEAMAVKPWRNAQWVSSVVLAKEDRLRRVPPKWQRGPRLPVLRSSLLRRMDKAVGLH